jgi:hypothetical protein
MTHTLKALSKAILLATCSLSASVAVAESNNQSSYTRQSLAKYCQSLQLKVATM